MARRLTDITSQSISHESTPPQCLVHCFRPQSSLEKTSVHCLVHFYWKTFPSVVEDISAQLISPKDTLLPEDTEMPFRSSLRLSIRPAVHSMEPSYQSPPHPDPPKPNQPLHQLTNRHTLLSLHVTQRHLFRLYYLIVDLYIRSMI